MLGLVPSLILTSKMDEVAVLDHLIKYLKHMEHKVKYLEKEQARKQRRSSFVEDEANSSEDVGSTSNYQQEETPEGLIIPEIEAKVCDKTLLIKIHCEKSKGLLVNLIAEIERLNLCVSTTNVTSFGRLALEITIVAEMEEEFRMSVKELVKALESVVEHSAQAAD